MLLLLLFFLNPRKNEGGKKLRKAERGPKWKTSPGGPLIIIIIIIIIIMPQPPYGGAL